MTSENEPKASPELKPAIRVLTWFTLCYLFSLSNFLGTSQGLWFWFYALQRPAWCLPNSAVTPVWTVVYGLAAWGAWGIWNSPPDGARKIAMISFWSTLTFTAIWPWLYFAAHQIIAALVVVALSFLASILTAVLFTRLTPKSGYLLVPLLAWSGYLTILYVVVSRLNR
jgi:tryptophan-rich sensory protein